MKEKTVMNNDNVIGFGVGLFAGAIIGGVLALLYAPESGKKTKKIIKDKVTEFVDGVVDAVKEETGEIRDKVEEVASGAEKKGEAIIKAINS